jgi:hypothetical protein
MIDVAKETLIRPEDVRDYLPSSRRGKKLSKAICFRWAKRGVGGVLLETIKVGGARLTSVEAVHRFVQAQNPRPGYPTLPGIPSPPPSLERQQARHRPRGGNAAADNALARRGI